MKKHIIYGFLGLVLLSACEETTTTTVDITGTGIITGTVFADTDQTDGQSQSEPLPGVNVRILWNSADLALTVDDDTTEVSLIVTTDSAGVYTAEVPTTDNGVIFDIEFDEIELDVTFNTGSGTATESAVFNSGIATASLKIGETVTEDFDYQSNFKSGTILDKFATISGTVFVDSEQINTEDVLETASGATVTVEWTQDSNGTRRSVSTTTDASGTYSVQVPTEDIESNDYDVFFEEFETSVDYFDGFRNVTGFTAVFNESEIDADNLEPGDVEEINFSYGQDVVRNLPRFALIEGTVRAQVDALTNDIDSIAGVIVRFTWVDEDGITQGSNTTTDVNGEYSAEVPVTPDVLTNDITVIFSRFTISNFNFNNGTDDVTGTAIYNEDVTASNDLEIGERVTVDRTYNSPDDTVEN